jgi:hypothetical protein
MFFTYTKKFGGFWTGKLSYKGAEKILVRTVALNSYKHGYCFL